MIIKKKHANLPDTPIGRPSASQLGTDEETVAYSEEEVLAGRAQNRRRNDRRQGYRRIEDQELISRAHEEANAIREKAHQEGFQEGLDKAQEVIESLQETIQSFLNAKEEAYISASSDLAAMAVDIAEQLIKTEVSCDDTLVLKMVHSTIAKVGRDQKSITIKVNPIDQDLVKAEMRDNRQISEAVEILVVEDTSVEPGSCMVETHAGQVDARFSTQLEILKRLLSSGGRY